MKHILLANSFIMFFYVSFAQQSFSIVEDIEKSTVVSNIIRPPLNCPPLPIPAVGYGTQSYLGSGINGEFNIYFPYGKCTDCTGFGVACYFVGWTTGLRAQYYPSTKVFDLQANLGYRNSGIIPFAKLQLGAGYAFIGSNSPYEKFFHIDPSVGFDLLVVNIMFGYSFRLKDIESHNGAVTFQASISPLLFFKSKPRSSLSTFMKMSKVNRRQHLTF